MKISMKKKKIKKRTKNKFEEWLKILTKGISSRFGQEEETAYLKIG